jgi:hypothetical protein
LSTVYFFEPRKHPKGCLFAAARRANEN